MKSKMKIVTLCAVILAAVGVMTGALLIIKNLTGKISPDTSSETSVTGVSDNGPDSSSHDQAVVPSGTNETAIPSETIIPPSAEPGAYSSGTITGDGVEGIPGTGAYNYGEALQKSLIFYELQRSGDLPQVTRCNWRGDSCLMDGSDAGLDLTGGWFDAGDNVKFNLPMAYTATMLGWSLYEDPDAYQESNQLVYALSNIRWANEYFIKCHPEDEVYYYQVGDGNADHGWWGPAECVEYQMNRPSYFVDAQHPGSAVTGETAASLAVCSIVFREVDPAFSQECLNHAISLYAFSEKYKSDAGYTAANGFYNSWSGFYDELSFAGAWLYRATGDSAYLSKAKEYYSMAGQDYDWALCWDDVHIGAAVLLAQDTAESTYTSAVEKHLDFWTTGTSSGERITYTPKGLAWLDTWGSLRYATTTAFVAAVYSESDVCPDARKDIYWDFAVAQAGYALGDTGFSYQIGFGDNYPVHPHHRTAQGSYSDNMNDPGTSRHTLCGALVGGPDASDGYNDSVSDYVANEVACDYNAGFTGLLAKLYTRYHGETLTGFGACEVPGEEYRVDATVNASGSDFLEIKALTYNMTGWPARAPEDLELRYYFDIPSGKTISDLSVSSSYAQNTKSVQLTSYNALIGCVQVIFEANSCYPGGQEEYKKEVQFRITGIPADAASTARVCIYEGGVLVYGQEPDGSGTIVTPDPGTSDPADPTTPAPSTPAPPPSGNEKMTVTVEYTTSGTGNSISANMTIENTGSDDIDLSGISIEYFFTNEGGGALAYECYHSAISRKGGNYEALDNVSGTFAAVDPKKDGADTACSMSGFGSGKLHTGDKLIVQFSIHHNDWSDFNLSDDYSRQATENIVIASSGTVLYGKRP